MGRSFLILPGCNDCNRGDQALIWETVALAKSAGYEGQYRMLSDEEGSNQSREVGIGNVPYILQHPAAKFKKRDNIKYAIEIKIKWGFAAIIDLITKEPLVHRGSRHILRNLYCDGVQYSLREFEKSEACFVKGGGFLHSYGGLEETYKIYYFLFHIRLALSLGKPVYILPNSFGPFRSPFTKGMICRVLSKCSVVMSREMISQDQLKHDCNVDSYLFADIAFHLPPDSTFDAKRELKDNGIPINEQTCVAITARPYRFPGQTNPEARYQSYQESLVIISEWLSDNGYFPVFIEHVFDENSHENDMTCISDITRSIKKTCNYGIFSNRDLTCTQIKKIYGEFKFIIGTRFHSVIFSLAQGIPAIAITYGGNKGDGIMADLGLQEFAIPIASITGDELIKKTETLIERYDQIKTSIQKALPQLTAQKEDIVQLLKGE